MNLNWTGKKYKLLLALNELIKLSYIVEGTNSDGQNIKKTILQYIMYNYNVLLTFNVRHTT
jgi:hypothetical protein